MIIARLMGGLGNQMFQYAAGRSLAIKRTTDLKLDLSWFAEQQPEDTPRHYELDCFNLAADIAEPSELRSNGFIYRLLKFKRNYPVPFYEEGHQYNPRIERGPSGIHLIGYWQSERYFKDIEGQLRKDFMFVPPLSKDDQKLSGRIAQADSVSLHVRRGDYITNESAKEFHGTCTPEYYRKATDLLAKQLGNPMFYIFSDDPGWCEENIKLPYPTTVVTGKRNGYEDMRLMSTCKHHIIANSSFSWWGAWLNKSRDKVVVAPKKWFTDSTINTVDQVPTSWRTI